MSVRLSLNSKYERRRRSIDIVVPPSVWTRRLASLSFIGIACSATGTAIAQSTALGDPVASGTTAQIPNSSGPSPLVAGSSLLRRTPPSASSQTPRSGPVQDHHVTLDFGSSRLGPNQDIDADNVTLKYLDATLTADRATGNMDREVILTGHAHVLSHDIDANADAIHAYPGTSSFRLDNLRGVVDPRLLEGRILDRLNLTGGDMLGLRSGYLDTTGVTATTCVEKHHHYELRAEDAEVFPHQRIVLRKASFFLFDVKVLTINYLVIPLDDRPHRPHSNYMPELGQDAIEGYYARIPYEFAESNFAATYVRLDITQNKGEGYRLEEEYVAGKQPKYYDTRGALSQGGGFTGATTGTIASSYGYGDLGHGLARMGTGLGPQSGGLFAMQGYFAEGFSRDFSASFRHQQSIGGDNRFSINTQLQNSSSFEAGGAGQTSQNTQFTFNHADAKHGDNADVSIGLTTNGDGASSNNQLSGSLHQSWDFNSKGTTKNSLSYAFDYTSSSYSSGTGVPETSTSLLDTQFQLQHVAREYTLGLTANKSIDLSPSSTSSGYGTLEKLPEIQFSTQTINYKGGYFAKLPAELDIGVGRYSEPGHENNTRLEDDRITFAFKTQDISVMRGNTEMTTALGFQQNFYSDTAAQYMLSDTTRLRQHLKGRSGFDLTYNYQQPEGATPFFFDLFNRVHNVTAEAGYLDDYHFQLTMQTGYNFLKDYQAAPWQSISTRMLVRPNPRLRFDFLATYDVNTGQWFNISNSVKIRANKNLAVDLVGVYDPQVDRWSQINTQYEIPLGRTWKFTGLIKYNGVLREFQSTNFQIAHEWDCLEASITYSSNPSSFVNDRELFLTVRIKAIPYFGTFARGPAGQAMNSATNGIF